HGHINAVGFFGVPHVPGAPSPRRLLFSDHNRSMRFTTLPESHRDGVGRVNLEEMEDAFSEGAGMESLVQNLRREDVGTPLDLIAGARMALHANAERAQFFDPIPYSAARHANFAGDFGAANDDHGVVGEQREERVD